MTGQSAVTGELADFPMRFVTPALLTDPPAAHRPRESRGTLTLLRLPGRQVGVTCHHVIEAYREQRGVNPSRLFMAGGRVLDPVDRLVAEDARLDLAVLDLDDVEPDALAVGPGPVDFFEPDAWPLGTAVPGELIGLGGYPAAPFVLGATYVIDAGIENIACAVQPLVAAAVPLALAGEDAQIDAHAPDLLGGLSGGPGFVSRGGRFHLVGVVFVTACHGGYVRLRPASVIRQDGTLKAA